MDQGHIRLYVTSVQHYTEMWPFSVTLNGQLMNDTHYVLELNTLLHSDKTDVTFFS